MKLRRPFVIASGSFTEVHNFLLRLDTEGSTGYGEAVPSARVTGESRTVTAAALQRYESQPEEIARHLQHAQLLPGRPEAPAAQGALVAAYLDAEGRRLGRPIHSLLNLPEGRIPSSITISVGEVDHVLQEAEEWDAQGWSIFKVKLGGAHDEAVIRALRDRYPDKGIRVDANEAWSRQLAKQRLAFLERHEVEFVEQPLPRTDLEGSAELARAFDLPIILDEPLLDSEDALRLVRAEAGDGGNIKLAKCGGPFEARRILKVLRDAGWKVMMGCNLETSLGIATAAAFAGALDYADLDGHVLLAQDPFERFVVRDGTVETPNAPGIGVQLSASASGLEPLHARPQRKA